MPVGADDEVNIFLSVDNPFIPFDKNLNVCLLDSATTHTILDSKYYFSSLTLHKANAYIISGPIEIIESFENATIILPNDTTLHIEDALLGSRLKRILLSFKNVYLIGIILKQ